jgi:photosystem II stability/assembly factor-like uncharacterized protein
MRLIAGTQKGVRVLRWVKGERQAGARARALEAEHIKATTARGASVFVGTGSGKAFVSKDRGSSWEPAQQGLECDAVCSLVAGSGASARIYAGTEPASVFVLDDGAHEWHELEGFKALEEAEEWRGYGDRRAHVQTLESDPHAETRLYAGVEVGGAYASDDTGRSWAPMDDGLYEDVHQLAVDPRTGSRLYAATGGGLYLSRNRGLSWERHPDEIGSLHATALLAKADRAGKTLLYLATADGIPSTWTRRGARARLHVSRDAGATWKEASVGAQRFRKDAYTVLAADPEDPEGAFIATAGGDIYHGSRGGEYWIRIHHSPDAIRTLTVL